MTEEYIRTDVRIAVAEAYNRMSVEQAQRRVALLQRTEKAVWPVVVMLPAL